MNDWRAVTVNRVVKNSQKLDHSFTDFFTNGVGVVGFGWTSLDWA